MPDNTTSQASAAEAEAIANANAHLNTAGLPTYDDLLAALKSAMPHLSRYAASICMMGGAEDGPEPACAKVRAVIAAAEVA